MIKLKETATSQHRDDAIKFIKNYITVAEKDGYKKVSDITVTRQRGVASGSNRYDAYVWLAKEE